MAYVIAQGVLVAENASYEVAVSGSYELLDFVPCRRLIDTNGIVQPVYNLGLTIEHVVVGGRNDLHDLL